MMPKPKKLKDRVREALENNTDELSKRELDLIADVGTQEDHVAQIIDVTFKDFVVIASAVLIREYRFTKDEATRFVQMFARDYDAALKNYQEQVEKQEKLL